jgi:menaquinone-dependent protoporphyrinogen IX oxidase
LILVSYFTKGGATEKYANIIAETLKSNGFTVETSNLAQKIPDITSYDTIILGTGVRMFRVYGRWKKVLKQKTIDSKDLFLFLSSGTAIDKPDEAVEKYLQPLVKKYNLKPKSMVSFPGIIPGKWAELDGQKDTLKPEKAKKWALDVSRQIKSK